MTERSAIEVPAIDLPTQVESALAWIEEKVIYLREYIDSPFRQAGPKSAAARELAEGRREVVGDVLTVSQEMVSTARRLLNRGELSGAACIALKGQFMIGEALGIFLTVSTYETGRVGTEVRADAQDAEADRRSEAGRKGAPKNTFADQALLDFLVAWETNEGRKWGRIKAAAAHFKVTEGAIRRRLRKIDTG
jgi:hypothetical protein